ncbi:MAG: TraB/GumN family protein [Verrucomicrobiota bacterium]
MNTRRVFIKSCTLALLATVLATGALAKSCLWKVTSVNGTLYLQGSIHVLKAGSYPLAPAIEQAYSNSTALVLEVDMKEMTSPETQQLIMGKAMLPGTSTLQQVLDEETYQKLGAACTQAGLPIAALAKFKPWFATTTLTLVQLQKMGFDSQYGLDTYFFDKATADGKKVIGLESVGFQIDLFDTLSEENPNDFTTRALTDLAAMEEDVASLEKAWETGDIDTLGTLISKGFEGYPEFHRTFVLDRNKRWFKTLGGLLETPETHMVVVGAGHLSGKGGLLELLKQKGYALEQL